MVASGVVAVYVRFVAWRSSEWKWPSSCVAAEGSGGGVCEVRGVAFFGVEVAFALISGCVVMTPLRYNDTLPSFSMCRDTRAGGVINALILITAVQRW